MKKLTSLIILSLLVFTSCEDELDINTDPNTPPEINKGLALSAVEGSLITVTGGELFNLGGIYAQYYTQSPGASQYENIETYNINTDYANRLWTELYAGALNDVEFVLDLSNEDGDTGTYLIATCLRSYTYQLLVDVFGDVPYEEALEINDNLSPSPTPGEEIYLDLIDNIDMALAQYETNPVDSEVGQQDLIYGADMDLWVQFANTLKLKLYLRMAYTPQANSTAVMDLINEDNFLTENAQFDAFSNASEQRHPYYEVQIEYLGNVNNVASNSLFEFLASNNDPRLEAIYTPNSSGDYVSIEQGIGLTNEFGSSQASEFSRPRIEPDTPVYLMTVAESNFLQAEALARYAGGSGTEELYNAGVVQSFALHDIPVSEAEALTEPGGVYEFNQGTVEEMVEQIIIQKWVALANVNNIEGWIETTRTKYPEITTSEDPAYEEGRRIVSISSVLPGNQIPTSIFYPNNEVTRNLNINQKESLTTNVWWDQK